MLVMIYYSILRYTMLLLSVIMIITIINQLFDFICMCNYIYIYIEREREGEREREIDR